VLALFALLGGIGEGSVAVALLGGAWFAGTMVYYAWTGAQGAPSSRKRCPDCAEPVRVDASVCKHCGYRWSSPADAVRP
jgi:hypothetical protein